MVLQGDIPDCYHVVVHLLQLLLGRLQGVGGWVELVCLETLIRESDCEWLVILLQKSKLATGFRSYRALGGTSEKLLAHLRDVFSMRRGSVGGDGAASNKGGLASQRRSLARPQRS
jgi:hypothetical protein